MSDENYEAKKDNPWYMGSVGPELEAVYEAGCEMTRFFLDKELTEASDLESAKERIFADS